MPEWTSRKARAALRDLERLERDFRHGASMAVNRIIAVAFTDANPQSRAAGRACLQRLIQIGGSTVTPARLAKLADDLEALETAIEFAASKSD